MKTRLTCSLALALAAAGSPPVAAAGARVAHTSTSQAYDCAAHGGEFLVATDGGLLAIDGAGAARARWTAVDGLPATRIQVIAVAPDGALWLGTEAGVARVEVVGGELTVRESIATEPVRAIAWQDKRMIAATWGGGVVAIGRGRARRIAPRGGRPDKTRDRATSLVVHDGAVYVGTAGAGLFRIDRNQLVSVKVGQGPSWIWSLASHRGRLWLGAMDGLYELAGDAAHLVATADVRDLAADGERLVAATFGDGIAEVRGGALAPRRDWPRDARFVYSLALGDQARCAATHDGTWVTASTGAKSGMLVRAAALAGPPSNDISALAVQGDRLWVATFDRGIASYRRGVWSAVADDRIDPKVNALAIDADGALWIATASGVAVMRGDRVTRLGKTDGMPARMALSLSPLSGGGMLVGTSRGAVAFRDGRAISLAAKQGLDTGNVWAVCQDDDGAIWLGTTKGLYRGRLDAPDRFVRFSVSTGHLADDWVMALEIEGRTLWAGSYKGGVVRLSWTEGAALADVTTSQLGGGWINPGGLARIAGKLYAATMDGLASGDGARAEWKATGAALGRDTTAVARQGKTLWVASRRGLVALAE